MRPLRILILIVLGLACGLIANAVNPRGLRLTGNVFKWYPGWSAGMREQAPGVVR